MLNVNFNRAELSGIGIKTDVVTREMQEGRQDEWFQGLRRRERRREITTLTGSESRGAILPLPQSAAGELEV